ncbi:MAG: hypothetical protein ABFS41_15935, partial [Myxococcota bacterium]
FGPPFLGVIVVAASYGTVIDDSGAVVGGTAGTPMTAIVVYDPDAFVPDPTPVQNGLASYYEVPAPPASFWMQIGPWTITSAGPFDPDQPELGSGMELSVFDRDASSSDLIDWYTTVVAVNGLDVPFTPGGSSSGFCCASAYLALIDTTASLLTSLALADAPLDLASWDDTFWDLTLPLSGFSSEIYVYGTITSLSVEALPEASTLAHLALGLGLVAVARRRRHAAGARTPPL